MFLGILAPSPQTFCESCLVRLQERPDFQRTETPWSSQARGEKKKEHIHTCTRAFAQSHPLDNSTSCARRLRHHPTQGEGGNTTLNPTPHSPQSTSSGAGHPGGGRPILGARASANARPRSIFFAPLLTPPRGRAPAEHCGDNAGGCDKTGVFGGEGGGGGVFMPCNNSIATGDAEKSSPSSP